MTRAEFHQDLLEMVATLNEAAGAPVLSVLHSPVIPPDPAHIPAMLEVRDRVAEYLRLHPDTIQGTPKRPTYNWDFVSFIVELLPPGQPGYELSYAELTAATNVPLETLYNWLHRKPHSHQAARLKWQGSSASMKIFSRHFKETVSRSRKC